MGEQHRNGGGEKGGWVGKVAHPQPPETTFFLHSIPLITSLSSPSISLLSCDIRGTNRWCWCHCLSHLAWHL